MPWFVCIPCSQSIFDALYNFTAVFLALKLNFPGDCDLIESDYQQKLWFFFHSAHLVNLWKVMYGTMIFYIETYMWPYRPLWIRWRHLMICHTLNKKSLTCFVSTKPKGSIVITKSLALRRSLCASNPNTLKNTDAANTICNCIPL